MTDLGEGVFRKVWWRVVLLLTLLNVLSSIDRVNISFAALQMNADLDLSKEAYAAGVSLFFVGYLLFQIPSIALLRGIGARLWVALTVVVWGVIATGMAFIHTAQHFYILRFFLGIAEAGFSPGMVIIVSSWLPSAWRGRAVGFTLLSIPLSVVIGGPLSGALMKIHALDIAGWRWMFGIEGIPTILLGLFALAWLSSRPATAAWLNADEKAWIADQQVRDRDAAGRRANLPFLRLILDPALWLLGLVWFALLIGSNALIFWLPQTLKSLTGLDPLTIGCLSALPWFFLGAGMLINARLSDKSGERIRHIAVPAVVGAVLFAAAAASGATAQALFLLVAGACALGAAQSVFWTVPTQVFSGSPNAVAIINLCGNLSGVLSPLVIAFVMEKTHVPTAPVYMVAGVLFAGAVLLLPVAALVKRNLSAQ